MNLDGNIKKAIMIAAEKNNVDYDVAKQCVLNSFNWMRSSMSNGEYSKYLMPKFATFSYFGPKQAEERRVLYQEFYKSTHYDFKNLTIIGDIYNDLEDREKVVEEIESIVDGQLCKLKDDTIIACYTKNGNYCFKKNYLVYCFTLTELNLIKNQLTNVKESNSNQKQSD